MADSGQQTGAPSEQGEVDVTALEVAPQVAAVDAPLDLKVRFRLRSALQQASWAVRYTVDVAGRKRHVLELGGSEAAADLGAGEHEWSYRVERMDVAAAGIKPKHLLRNVGLLSLSLTAQGADVLDVRLVTQVAKGGDGSLVRTVFNPLDA